jgi:hypothetical protein
LPLSPKAAHVSLKNNTSVKGSRKDHKMHVLLWLQLESYFSDLLHEQRQDFAGEDKLSLYAGQKTL